MLRGMNKQDIFHDNEDYRKFMFILKDCKEKSNFELYAFCLMTNHVHLLIKEVDEPLEVVFKRIGVRYVYYYNSKYDRLGSLFQDRFLSIPVEDDEYFISALRYIHNNPVKAKMIKNCADYTYSSYNDYINKSGITDYNFALDMMSESEFIRMHNDEDLFTHIDIEDRKRISYELAERIYMSVSDGKSQDEIKRMPDDELSKLIATLKDKHLSCRQISSLTGLYHKKIR